LLSLFWSRNIELLFHRQGRDRSTIQQDRLDHRSVDPHEAGTGSIPFGDELS
jgi:hypothetical protein